jgi:hypothetical protein
MPISINDLFSQACARLPKQLASLKRRGAGLDDHVWAFFDATQEPGRRVAIAHIQNTQGRTLNQASKEIDSIAKKTGSFTLGLMQTKSDFAEVLQSLGAPASMLDWLKDSRLSEDHFAVIATAGSETKMAFVELPKADRRLN